MRIDRKIKIKEGSSKSRLWHATPYGDTYPKNNPGMAPSLLANSEQLGHYLDVVSGSMMQWAVRTRLNAAPYHYPKGFCVLDALTEASIETYSNTALEKYILQLILCMKFDWRSHIC